MTPAEKDALLYAKTGKVDQLRACLDAGISPDLTDDSRVNLLVYAASRGHLAVVEELLRRGADPDFVSGWDDSTALFQARLAGHSKVAELLEQHTSRRKGYHVAAALQCASAWEGYCRLHDAIWSDFQRGRELNASENAFLALHAFLTCGTGWGIEDMLSNRGYWVIPDGIRLFDTLGEPRYAALLRRADTIVKSCASRTGYKLDADPPETFRWDPQATDELEDLKFELFEIEASEHERLSREALDFVQQNPRDFGNAL